MTKEVSNCKVFYKVICLIKFKWLFELFSKEASNISQVRNWLALSWMESSGIRLVPSPRKGIKSYLVPSLSTMLVSCCSKDYPKPPDLFSRGRRAATGGLQGQSLHPTLLLKQSSGPNPMKPVSILSSQFLKLQQSPFIKQFFQEKSVPVIWGKIIIAQVYLLPICIPGLSASTINPVKALLGGALGSLLERANKKYLV